MDVLKGITDGLRTSGDDAQNETDRTGGTETHGRESADGPSGEESRLEGGGHEADESSDDRPRYPETGFECPTLNSAVWNRIDHTRPNPDRCDT